MFQIRENNCIQATIQLEKGGDGEEKEEMGSCPFHLKPVLLRER